MLGFQYLNEALIPALLQ
ncbi:hypothetical protein CGLO_14356 [Colletotrichum gloeosporioides Cg-14]|uniref:Uncharacterized protein n=1 Tax=Colletotrichum gloeosporioides (strain Cg-14) TaxID=1237896 RepID=T0JUF6_COLGC|nr:hypothetical protein CGLO_14356 [Colletotrichum gloeosporioides Cg-14]